MISSIDYQVTSISWLVVLLHDVPLFACGELASKDCRLNLVALGQSCIVDL
jgi:hypothetical protein